MEAIKCELCGSSDLIKQDGFFVCQHCGTKYTPEEANKLFVTYVIDNTGVRENNRILARRAMQTGDIPEARRYYDALLFDEPNNWEAYYFSSICKTLLSSDADREEDNLQMFGRSILTTVHMIVSCDPNREFQESAFNTVLDNMNQMICDRTYYIESYYKENKRSEGLPFEWLWSKTTVCLDLFSMYKQAVSWNFTNPFQLIKKADCYQLEYVSRFSKSVSWKQRHDVRRNTQYLSE